MGYETTRQLFGTDQLIRDQFPLLFSGLVSLLKSIEYNDEQSKILTKNRYIIYHNITCIYIHIYIYVCRYKINKYKYKQIYIYICIYIYMCVCMLFFWFTENLPYSGKFRSFSQPTASDGAAACDALQGIMGGQPLAHLDMEDLVGKKTRKRSLLPTPLIPSGKLT